MPAATAPETPNHEPRDELAAVPAFLRRRAGLAAGATPLPIRSAGPGSHGDDAAAPVDPRALPMATIPSRHVARAIGVVLAVFVALSLARQVGDAAASSARVDGMRASNVQLRAEVGSLKSELATISDKRFVALAARARGLGGPGEIPFALPANVPSLTPDAPGSATVRLGAADAHRSPLDTWLSILFGDGG